MHLAGRSEARDAEIGATKPARNDIWPALDTYMRLAYCANTASRKHMLRPMRLATLGE